MLWEDQEIPHHNFDCFAGDSLDQPSRYLNSLNKSEDQIEKECSDGCSLLHLACLTTDIGMVELLLQYGANINASDSRGRTPLHLCVVSGKSSIAKLLLTRWYLIFLISFCSISVEGIVLFMMLRRGKTFSFQFSFSSVFSLWAWWTWHCSRFSKENIGLMVLFNAIVARRLFAFPCSHAYEYLAYGYTIVWLLSSWGKPILYNYWYKYYSTTVSLLLRNHYFYDVIVWFTLVFGCYFIRYRFFIILSKNASDWGHKKWYLNEWNVQFHCHKSSYWLCYISHSVETPMFEFDR